MLLGSNSTLFVMCSHIQVEVLGRMQLGDTIFYKLHGHWHWNQSIVYLSWDDIKNLHHELSGTLFACTHWIRELLCLFFVFILFSVFSHGFHLLSPKTGLLKSCQEQESGGEDGESHNHQNMSLPSLPIKHDKAALFFGGDKKGKLLPNKYVRVVH